MNVKQDFRRAEINKAIHLRQTRVLELAGLHTTTFQPARRRAFYQQYLCLLDSIAMLRIERRNLHLSRGAVC
jgi:hypothetical protein